MLKWVILVSCAGLSVASIHWPDIRMERLDALLWEESLLTQIINNCPVRSNSTIAAQWVRLAYHDMSTHNVDDGTGGLDASIAYELDRAQNIGSGMAGSVSDLIAFTDPGATFSDVIAMGAVLGVAACGGPLIPFRGGRVDATAAGPPTVPEPQQDLASHMESFRRQGFTQSEMIALVACGHTLGGVRRQDFPDVIQSPGPADEVIPFDGTNSFDNPVVTGYLQGTTANPLAVGPNATTNSDLRIFFSDGNVTMQSLAPPDNFNSVCSELFERMLNTVPKDVQLTDVIEPIQYKVLPTRFFVGKDGLFRLTTGLRAVGVNPTRTVALYWTDREGTACPATGCSMPPISAPGLAARGSFMAVRRGLTGFPTYRFDARLNTTNSISKFWFKVDEGDGSEPVLVDNDGAGLPIAQDDILFDTRRSSFFTNSNDLMLNIVIAVRTDDATAKVTVSRYVRGTPSDPVPKREVVELSADARFPPISGYTFFSRDFISGTGLKWMDVKAEVGGKIFSEKDVEIIVPIGAD
ncbi:hypothetical protein PQX77_019330 [Marasmius sp. AFHP31]|nr:hypothetical protein PQX77_019330 [Marasmius sp. AFHP31]